MNYKQLVVFACGFLLSQCAGKNGPMPSDADMQSAQEQSVTAKDLHDHAVAKKPDWVQTQGDGIYKLGKPYKVNGVWYFPKEDLKYDEVGIASWYGPGFHMKQTANGETFDMDMVSGAHKTLPLPSVVRVTNLENGRSILVRINDRGPFVNDRLIDISRKGAELLGFMSKGTAKVRVELMPEETMTVMSMAQNKTHKAAGEEAQLSPAEAGIVNVSHEDAKTAQMMQPPLDDATPPHTYVAQKGDRNLADATAHLGDNGMMDITSEIEAHHKLTPEEAQDLRSSKPEEVPTSASGTIFVQVGAFGSRDNAKRLVSNLSAIGDAKLHETHLSGRTIYRVRFGPYDDTANAQKVHDEILATGHKDVKILMED